jgi:hypothetical protein
MNKPLIMLYAELEELDPSTFEAKAGSINTVATAELEAILGTVTLRILRLILALIVSSS